VRFRVRIPDGEHEPPPDPGGRDPVPDPVRTAQLHFFLAGARNRPAGRRRVRLRAGHGAGSAARGPRIPRGRLTHPNSCNESNRGRRSMKNTMRVMLAASLVLGFTACKKEEAAPAAEAQQALVAPAKDDDAGWRKYLQAVAVQNMGNITNNPFLYYLVPESDPEFDAKYQRQVESATAAIGRGVSPGNMLAFGSSA